MIFKLELKDDWVLISTRHGNSWTLWGMLNIEAFYESRHFQWYVELKLTGNTVVNYLFTLDTSLQLPPDNLS